MNGEMLVGWLVMEVAVNIIFLVINPWLGPSTTTFKSLFKGVLERIFLSVGLLTGYPHVITAFGALKIGTRLHEEKNSEISNDYFLIGNFISLLTVIIYVYICYNFFGWN
ncbi:MAG: hypothetical protein JXR20_03465 [Balneola sp.]